MDKAQVERTAVLEAKQRSAWNGRWRQQRRSDGKARRRRENRGISEGARAQKAAARVCRA